MLRFKQAANLIIFDDKSGVFVHIYYIKSEKTAWMWEKCAKKREFTEQEKNIISQIGKKYNVDFNLDGKFTYDAIGCSECNNSGYYERTGIFEVLNVEDNIKELIENGASSIEIREQALKRGYKPLIVDGINKVIEGITTLGEIDKKIIIN